MKIYLAGAMSGVTWEEANEWRDDIIEYYYGQELDVNLEIFNPCLYVADGAFSSDDEDMKFDLYNLRHSDIMIVNWDADSIGTAIEIGVAKEHDIPIFVYTTDADRLYKMHPWVKNSAMRVFDNMADLLSHINSYWM